MSKYKINKYKMLRLTNLDNNLGKNEKLIYNHLILCFDEEKGFAYPPYPELMQVLGVKRRNSVADTVEGLREKDYIETKKGFRGANNYYLLKYITSNENDTSNTLDTSNENVTRTSNKNDTRLVTKPLLNNINNKLNNKVNINSTKKTSRKNKKVYIDLSNMEIEHIKLTQEEYNKLIVKYTESLVKKKLVDMESYEANRKKKYLDHYKALCSWLNKEQSKDQQIMEQPKAQLGKSSIDYSKMTPEQIMAIGRGEGI